MTRPARAALAAATAVALALAGCPSGEIGTISLGLATAPGSTVMDRVVQLRVTLTNPRRELVVDRTERGFDLVLDLDPSDALNTIVIEGLDTGGALVAAGMSPPFPLSAINARIVVYLAVPMSVGVAPAALAPPRSRAAAGALAYGAILAGGVDETGAPSAAVQIYNAFDHSLVTGLPLPGPRAGVTPLVAAADRVYLFGGTAPGGAPTGTLWAFDTTAMPSGRYVVIGDFPQFARTGAAAVPTGPERFLITGAPSIELAGSMISEPAGIAAISSGASVTGSDRVTTAVIVDDATGSLIRIRAAGTPEPLAAQRRRGTAAALPDARLAVLGGDTAPRDAIIVDAASGEVTPVSSALADAYDTLVVAATPRFVVAAGTRAGTAATTVEILDAATLAPRHVTSVDDQITAAIALPNEQVLLVGAALHLFTPPPPPAP